MEKFWVGLALSLALLGSSAQAADYKILRNLNAPGVTTVAPLPLGEAARNVQFARILIHPRDGEAWAIAYESIGLRAADDDRPTFHMLTWDSGRIEGDRAAFERSFDEELTKAGFKTVAGESLFDSADAAAADLKVGVLVDDIKGRYCVDCPNVFNRKGIPASVVMTAHWEIYSSLERKVVAKVTTTGGADFQSRLNDSVLPPVLAAFREQVRQLLASPDFRTVVTAPVRGASPTSGPSAVGQAPVGFIGSKSGQPIAQTLSAIAIVFASDGSGSGFLLSKEGYVLTNQHVVGGSKFVKLKWSDGSETLGEVIRTDARRDVALVKTDPQKRTPLGFRPGAVQVGEAVFAVGSPLGEKQQNTVTKGIVSASRSYDGLSFIQSDVAVTHGNSGGPLLDEKGRVIGLTVSGLAPNGAPIGLNFFIPIDEALRALALTPAG